MTEQEDQVSKVAALEEELAQMRRALVSHAVVDQAIGVVLACGGVPPEEGWEILREVSQRTNTKLREVAEHLVQWPHCGWLPPEIRHGLETALERRKPSRLPARKPAEAEP